MRPKYDSKVNLCYMETDSFVYEIVTEDFYRDIAKDVEKRLNTSGYSKNENRSLPIQKCVVSEGLTIEDYKTCLFDGKTVYREQMLFEKRSTRCTRLISIR